MENNNKCVYLHKDADGVVRYVGSGSLSRANATHDASDRGKDYSEYVEANGRLKVEIVAEGLSKLEAENLERELYDKYIDTILNHRRPNSIKTMTKEMFEDYLYYDETSKSYLRWKVNGSGRGGYRIKAGSEAGSLNKSHGYYQIRLNRKLYYSHRIIALLHDLDIEGKVIDHIDRDRTNNKISNLRVVTHQENNNNKSMHSSNNSGVQGVHFNKQQNRWVATRYENQKQKVKYFLVSAYESYEAAKQAAIEYRRQMEDLFYNAPSQ